MDTLVGHVDHPQPTTRAEAILLVDDDDLYVRAITRQLRALGFPYVFRAGSAADALDMLQRVRPTVVLTDMVMEHRESGRWVIAAADQLGVSVAVVSAMPGLDETVVGRHFCRKSDLDAARLERLLDTLIAENRTKRRESSLMQRTRTDLTQLAPSSTVALSSRKIA